MHTDLWMVLHKTGVSKWETLHVGDFLNTTAHVRG